MDGQAHSLSLKGAERERLAVIDLLHSPPLGTDLPTGLQTTLLRRASWGLASSPETDAVKAAWLLSAYFDCPRVPSLLVVS